MQRFEKSAAAPLSHAAILLPKILSLDSLMRYKPKTTCDSLHFGQLRSRWLENSVVALMHSPPQVAVALL